jgi:putative Holliday junction resolvase
MNIVEFKQQIPQYKALIGFDYGTKRLGVAVSDLLLTVATSYKIIYRSDLVKDIAEIKKIIKEKEIGGMVFGLPLQMNGEEGSIAAEVREFAAKLHTETGLPYFFWDERLSSSAVERFLISEVDLSRQKRKKILDASAAAYILQGALDALNYR